MGNLYRFDVAEPKHGNEIPPSPTIFEREPLKSKTTFVVKYIYLPVPEQKSILWTQNWKRLHQKLGQAGQES
jgi:hypothetical protein